MTGRASMDTVSRNIRGAIVVPSFAQSGSFAARATWPGGDDIVEIIVAHGSGARVVHARGDAWVVASVDVLRDVAGYPAGTETRRARSLPNGGIEARLETVRSNGTRIRRSLDMAANGDWTSAFSAALSNGSSVSGRGAKVGRQGPIRFDRRKVGRDGAQRWSVEGQTHRRADRWSDTIASGVYPFGGTAKYRQVVREIDKILVKQRTIKRDLGVAIPNESLGGLTGKGRTPGSAFISQEDTYAPNG